MQQIVDGGTQYRVGTIATVRDQTQRGEEGKASLRVSEWTRPKGEVGRSNGPSVGGEPKDECGPDALAQVPSICDEVEDPSPPVRAALMPPFRSERLIEPPLEDPDHPLVVHTHPLGPGAVQKIVDETGSAGDQHAAQRSPVRGGVGADLDRH